MSATAAPPLRIPRPRAILFDWDNTLVDSWATIHEALNIVMAAMDKPLWSLRETKERVRLSLRESFPRHFGERWEEARRIYLDSFRAIHLERLTALPGRGELLRGLADEGIFLGVVSNKTGALLRREVEQLGWSALFGSIVGAGDAPADKPDAAPVLLALEQAASARARRFGSSATPGSTWNAPATAAACRSCSERDARGGVCRVRAASRLFRLLRRCFDFIRGL